MRKFQTACGGVIVIPQKAENHLVAHPEVRDLLPEAIGLVVLPSGGAFLSTEVEMGRVVGKSGCVQTAPITPCDRALFAQRVGRARPTRVVVGEAGSETTKVVVLAFASREDPNTYVLATSWVGDLAPLEPWDPMIRSQMERQESLDFWCSNALIWTPGVMGEPFEATWEIICK